MPKIGIEVSDCLDKCEKFHANMHEVSRVEQNAEQGRVQYCGDRV